jgi:hypothetical protein
MKTQHFEPVLNAILAADNPHLTALHTVQAAVDYATKNSGLPKGYLDQMQDAVDYLTASWVADRAMEMARAEETNND